MFRRGGEGGKRIFHMEGSFFKIIQKQKWKSAKRSEGIKYFSLDFLNQFIFTKNTWWGFIFGYRKENQNFLKMDGIAYNRDFTVVIQFSVQICKQTKLKGLLLLLLLMKILHFSFLFLVR